MDRSVRNLLWAGILVIILSATQASAADLASQKMEIGIDRSGLAQQSDAVKEKTLGEIHSLGATWFRDGPGSGEPEGIANFVDEVRRAKQHQLKVLMIVTQMDSDFAAVLPEISRCGWKVKELSKIDLDKFALRLRATLDALKAAHLTVDAVEFGNDYDQFCYDADVPRGHLAGWNETLNWLRGYAHFLKAGAEILHDPKYFPQAKIITFGMAHINRSDDKLKEHIETPAKALAMLANLDGYNYLDNSSYHVDGFGLHIHASPNNLIRSVTTKLAEDESYLGQTRPFWITEWGFLDAKAFPNRQGQTLSQSLQIFLNIFDSLRSQISFGPLMFDRYDDWLTDADGKLLPPASVLSTYALHKRK